MSVGELLFKLLEYIYTFWPFRVVQVWESGLRIRLGNPIQELSSKNGLFGSGLHFFWPWFEYIETRDSNWEVLETERQTHTVSGQTITFSLSVRYRIVSMLALYTKIHDPDGTIMNELQSLAGSAVDSLNTYEDPEDFVLVDEARENLSELVEEAARKSLGEWGILIEEDGVALISCSEAETYRILTDPMLVFGSN